MIVNWAEVFDFVFLMMARLGELVELALTGLAWLP